MENRLSQVYEQNTSNFKKFYTNYNDLFDWMIDNGLICINNLCYKCDNIMILKNRSKRITGYTFYCQQCQSEQSILNGTFFEESKLTLLESYFLIFICFRQGMSINEANNFFNFFFDYMLKFDTIQDVFAKLRDNISIKIENDYSEPIGGFEDYIAVDESLFGKRGWVLGMHDFNSQEIRLFQLNDRSEESIRSLIEENVEPGSVIVHDGWASYSFLNNNEKYYNVEHIHGNFDWGFGEESTSQIESEWSYLKRSMLSLYNTFPSSKSIGFLREIEWRRNNKVFERNIEEELIKILKI